MNINNGDIPIAPHEQNHGLSGTLKTSGLTKREHFAALAMQSLADNTELTVNDTVKASVLLADALLKELDK